MIDDKVHKPKAVPIGPHVMLDAERCILCSRCVRFCDTITKTGELGIFNRGDHSELGLFPGTVARQRVLRQRRRHLPGGRADRPRLPLPGPRLVPRPREVGLPGVRPRVQRRGPHQHASAPTTRRAGGWCASSRASIADVNQWWICDEGRYGFGDVDAPTRLERPELREGGTARAAHLGGGRGRGGGRSPRRGARGYRRPLLLPDVERGPLARPAAVRGHARRRPRGLPRAPADARLGGRPPAGGRQDPEHAGAPSCSAAAGPGAADGRHVLEAARAGRLRLLWVFDHDLLDSGWPRAEVEEALARVEGVVFQGPNANATSARAHVVLPSAAWVEREGTWTNVDGRVQRFWRAVLPRGRRAAGLGDPGGGRARPRPGLAAAPRGDTSSATWRPRRRPSRG